MTTIMPLPQTRSLPPDVARELDRLVGILIKHGARQILLYGSYARGDFGPTSDLDLCVEGLPPDRYFRAWAECLMTTDRHVSLLDLADVKGYLRERILSEGRIIYDHE